MTQRYKVGQEVVVNTKDIQDKRGTIRYIGKIQGKNDQFIGLELDEPCGKNNGQVNGKPYFKVQKNIQKGMFGVFVKAISLKPVPDTKKTKVGSKAPQTTQGRTKLSNELMMDQQPTQLQNIKEELQSAYQKIRTLEELDSVKEVESLRQKIKEYEQLNRSLKLELEQTRYSTDANQQEQLKELAERLQFFKSQKQSGERERSQLRKKIERLQTELEESAERDEMLDKLTIKIQILEAKNEKMKSQLESANTQLKNNEMLGGGKSSEELQQNISTLNQMISLLESDLNEEREKTARLENELQQSNAKLGESVRLQRKIKSKDEEIETLKIELEAFSDAASFVEKLTLDLITKEQVIRDQTKRLKELAEANNKLEGQIAESGEMVALQAQEMESLEEEVQKEANEKAEQQKHIMHLGEQIAKYKQKIRELSDNNSSLMMNLEDKEDDNIIRNYFSGDVFQHKYYELSKLHQASQEQFLQFRLSMSSVRHYAGISLANIHETLPQSFSNRMYPSLLSLLLKLAGTNYHLYLLFEVCAEALTHRSQLYSAEQEHVAGWLLLLLEQIPELFISLFKIELAITSSDSEADISEIAGHPQLRQQLSRIDSFTQELLQRVVTETIDCQVAIDPYTDPVDLLDQLSASIQRLPTQLATRHELCVQSMKGVHQILSSIELYRRSSQARETAQVDILLQNFLKVLESYMRECCTNPHIRLKTDMKSFISGVDLITKILKEVELNDNLQELGSLYSDTDDIRMLKETIMTTQFHLRELQKDLEQITYPSPLSRLHVRLPGKLWQDKLKSMKEELTRFETTVQEKVELQQLVSQQKRKILLLEKDLKDSQVTKELHERRIGELQLKVEQAVFLQSDFKRQSEKLSSLEEASKIIEDELAAQSRRKKEVQQELRKTREKFDIFQTETMMKQKKLKNSSLSSEDISNLAIFKSVVAEAGALRNHATKLKINQLKFSAVVLGQNPSNYSEVSRRQIINTLVDYRIGGSLKEVAPRDQVQGDIAVREYSMGSLALKGLGLEKQDILADGKRVLAV